MSAYRLGNAPNLYNADGSPAGQMGLDGVEYPSSVSWAGKVSTALAMLIPSSGSVAAGWHPKAGKFEDVLRRRALKRFRGLH